VSSIFQLPGIADLVQREDRSKVYGVMVGIVTKNKDEKGRYMVRVRLVSHPNGSSEGAEETTWCRIATFGAGDDRGAFFLPELDDEVLVAFENGDFNRPYVIGTLWNKNAAPPTDNNSQDGKNNDRILKTRSGHIFRFGDDKEGKKEQIEIKSAGGAQILIDDTDGGHRVHIQDQKKENYLTLDKEAKKITLETSTGEILIKAKKKIQLEADTIETISTKDTKMEAKQWQVVASDKFTIQGNAAGDVVASNTLTLIGSSKVNIN
jgi:uncharacterized protein involved in type VI secretion and phage assembly